MTSFNIYHPIASHEHRVGIQDLMNRCPPALLRDLENAMRLAKYRQRTTTQIEALTNHVQQSPWSWGYISPTPAHGSEHVLPDDLLRALLASHSELIAELLDAQETPSPWFTESVAHWRTILENERDTPLNDYLELDPVWRTQLTLHFLVKPNAVVDIQMLLGLIPSAPKQLGQLHFMYHEGLVTLDEIINHMSERVWNAQSSEHTMSRVTYGLHVTPPMPRALLVNPKDLGQIDHHLNHGPGIILLCETMAHATDTLYSLELRHLLKHERESYGFNVNNFHGLGGIVEYTNEQGEQRLSTTYGSVGKRMIFGLSSQHLNLCPDDSTERTPPHNLVEYLTLLACDPSEEFRVILALTQDQFSQLQKETTAARHLHVISLRPETPPQHFALTMCQQRSAHMEGAVMERIIEPLDSHKAHEAAPRLLSRLRRIRGRQDKAMAFRALERLNRNSDIPSAVRRGLSKHLLQDQETFEALCLLDEQLSAISE